MKPKAWSNRLTTKHNTMRWQRSTTVWQRNTMRWELSPTGWQRNTTHWQRSTTDWKCVSMRWQRTTTHLQCIDNGLQRIFKAQRVFVDFPYAGFSQIGSHILKTWITSAGLYIRAGSRRTSPASLPGFAGYFHCFTSQDMSRRWCLSGLNYLDSINKILQCLSFLKNI